MKAQQIARLSRRCFGEVEKIANDVKRYLKSQRVTGYTSEWLKATMPEEAAYNTLVKVVSEDLTIADLNRMERVSNNLPSSSLFTA